MNEAVRCPGCHAQLLAPVLPTERDVACPRCNRVFELPRPQLGTPPKPVARFREAPVDAAEVDAAPITTVRRPVYPRGAAAAWLAMCLLTFAAIAFGLQAAGKVALIVLIREQHALGAERGIPNPELERFFFRRIAPPPPPPAQAALNERWEMWEEWTPTANRSAHLTFWPALLLMLLWLRHAHANLPDLNAAGLSFTPAWAVFAFAVPVFNIFAPFALLQEIWRASHPSAIATPDAWRNGSYARSVRVWWLLYAGAAVLWLGAFFTTPGNAETYDELLTSAAFVTAASLCSAGACALMVYFIVKVRERQWQRYANLCDAG